MELEESLHQRVVALSAAGDAAADAERYDVAVRHYREALALLPEPPEQWDAALWLFAAIGDAAYLEGDLELARSTFMEAMKSFGSSRANPFMRLRLGQCLYDLGEFPEAEEWLAGAFLLEGCRLFADEDPRYLAFARSNLLPPPGGWPDGW